MHIARSAAVLIMTLTALGSISGCSPLSTKPSTEASTEPTFEASTETFLDRVRADMDAKHATDEDLLAIGEEMCSIAEGLNGDELEGFLDAAVASVDDPEMAANIAVLSIHALAHLCPEQGQKLSDK